MSETFNLTKSEREHAKRFGKFYLKLFKTLGTFFLLGIILTSITLISSDPAGQDVQLAAGESTTMSSFFVEAGSKLQYSFVIFKQNGSDYQYSTGQTTYYDEHSGRYYTYDNGIDGPDQLYQHMQNMDKLVRVQLYYSDSMSFTNPELVKSVSGDVNVVNMEVYKDGFYRFTVSNLDNSDLVIGMFHAEANLALVAATVVVWILFAMTLGFTAIAFQVGFWIVMIYVIVKAVKMIQEENNRTYPNVIGPKA